MSRIKSKNTLPELTVRRTLHQLGYRYRLHAKGLPGSPDLVFSGMGKIIFVHGCFWHGHSCKQGRAASKSNVQFWTEKITRNKARDVRVSARLRSRGWHVLTIWECQIKKDVWLNRALRFLAR
nr:very short patch repair endonuclease [Variovorax sp. IB41]